MATAKRRGKSAATGAVPAPDLFSVTGSATLYRLDAQRWPTGDRFLVNRSQAHVGDLVVSELTTSTRPLVIAGFAAIATDFGVPELEVEDVIDDSEQ